MAIVFCRSCTAEIFDDEMRCPKCGGRGPMQAKLLKIGSATLVVGLALAIVFVQLFPKEKPTEAFKSTRTAEEEKFFAKQVTAAAERATAKLKAKKMSCDSDYNCYYNKHASTAEDKCQPHIEKLANYDFEWTGLTSGPFFNKGMWLNEEKGELAYGGDNLKFQNGFGAWQNIRFRCDYSPRGGSVLAVTAEPGKY